MSHAGGDRQSNQSQWDANSVASAAQACMRLPPVRRPESSVGTAPPVFDPFHGHDLDHGLDHGQSSSRHGGQGLRFDTSARASEYGSSGGAPLPPSSSSLSPFSSRDPPFRLQDPRWEEPYPDQPRHGFGEPPSLPQGPPDLWDREVLRLNNIYMRSRREPLPEHIQRLVTMVKQRRSSSDQPIARANIESDPLYEEVVEGTVAFSVEDYYRKDLFALPTSANNPLRAYGHIPMHRRAVPFTDAIDELGDPVMPIITPVPSLMFGYNSGKAFPERHLQLRLSKMQRDVAGTEAAVTMLLPFLVVEFRGGDGDMREAANQCMSGAASCVNMVDKINRLVLDNHRQGDGKAPITESAAFSVATTGDESRLMIRNIIDWGKAERLQAIQRALAFLFEKLDKVPAPLGPGAGTQYPAQLPGAARDEVAGQFGRLALRGR
ncbi:hypothetical protein SCUCBS95973_009294 [Sporothrix curviconia]|uniref:DUF7924 domain-containing protein n=1 Tax=Sporothrix curviconia TaxID=1260050 RepID=A0ABP0CVB8_9PEZI